MLVLFILLKIIEGPRFSDEGIISSNIYILQNMDQIFLMFMPMNPESMWLLPMHNSAISVSQMHIHPNTLSKGSGWGKEIRAG